MACVRPATGVATKQYYVLETTCGVTPSSPAWKPLRFTGGVPSLAKDFFQSAELDGSREVNNSRGGANSVSASISTELYYGSHDDLLQACYGGTWSTGATLSGLTVTVNAAGKTFTRSAGDFTSDISVGDLVQFVDLVEGDNSKPVIVTAVTALVITASAAEGLANETSATTDVIQSDLLNVGLTRRSFSILTHFTDADSGAGEYQIAKGMEIASFNFTVEPNASVTGSFEMIGQSLDIDTSLPAGSTFPSTNKTEEFSGIDGRVLVDDAEVAFVTSASISSDNASSAKYVLGNQDTAYITQGVSNNTLGLSTFFLNSDNLTLFKNETEFEVAIILDSVDGAYAWRFPRCVYTSGTAELSGAEDMTQSLEAQAMAGTGASTGVSAVQLMRIAK